MGIDALGVAYPEGVQSDRKRVANGTQEQKSMDSGREIRLVRGSEICRNPKCRSGIGRMATVGMAVLPNARFF